MPDKRPTERELHKKIQEAKDILKSASGIFANPAKVVNELYYLNIDNSCSVWQLICELLNELSPKDYAGCNPPQKSYEKTIEGVDLFAFCWSSERLKKKMYLKFALKNGRFYYVSLHPSRLSQNNGETI